MFSQGSESIIIEEIIQVHKLVGRLRFFKHKWKEITSDKYILGYIKGYRIPFLQNPSQKVPPKERKFSDLEAINIETEIDR